MKPRRVILTLELPECALPLTALRTVGEVVLYNRQGCLDGNFRVEQAQANVIQAAQEVAPPEVEAASEVGSVSF